MFHHTKTFMKTLKENYLYKSSLVNFETSLTLTEINVKYLEKNSIAIGIVYGYIFSFISICYETKACDTHSINL